MASTGIIPTYQRFVNGAPVPSSSKRSFRVREKYLILLVIITFVIVCFSAFFDLPDYKASNAVNNAYIKVYEQLQNAPQLLMPPPPHSNDVLYEIGLIRHGDAAVLDPHKLEDKVKLLAKIEQDEMNQKVLERPNLINTNEVNINKNQELDKSALPPRLSEENQRESAQTSKIQLPVVQGGEDRDPVARERRNKIKQVKNLKFELKLLKRSLGQMTNSSLLLVLFSALSGILGNPMNGDSGLQKEPKTYSVVDNDRLIDKETQRRRRKVQQMMHHAWDNYVRYAWGKNELRPITKRGHTASIFGTGALGATIVDGLDTLYIMGMEKEYKQGRDWIATHFNISSMISDLSVFETNIRFIGGFLSCYALTGDIMFRDKALMVAEKLLPAFQTQTGIPNSLINIKTKVSKNYGWASGGCSILSEFGTLHLEFSYLSDVTGNPLFRSKVDHIRRFLQGMEKPRGLYPNYLNPKTGKWGQHHMSIGALGDSFYEYLLKAWIQSNQEDQEARELFDNAMANIFAHMLKVSPGGLTYITDIKYERAEHKMDHLACFSGGLFGLASVTLQNEMSGKYLEIAEGITNTCHESYDRSVTKLGPESFRFTETFEAKAIKTNDKYYILRPEVVESYFYMWRLTKNQKYREWGWEAVEAIEKYCRVSGGYTGIKNVYLEDSQKDDVQQSFFLAETLKYLYLLYSDDSLLSFNEWVFNTEAHPLPIKGVNPLYRGHEDLPTKI